MLKLTVGMLAVVLASTASAAGWRSLRIDASSEEAFNESAIEFRAKLPYVRQQVFERSLQDIWAQGMKAAQAEGRDYTVSDYLRAVDGLSYQQIVKFTDPSGATADRYWAQAYASIRRDEGLQAGEAEPFRREGSSLNTPYPYTGAGRNGAPSSGWGQR